jgi:hypothetical protein
VIGEFKNKGNKIEKFAKKDRKEEGQGKRLCY